MELFVICDPVRITAVIMLPSLPNEIWTSEIEILFSVRENLKVRRIVISTGYHHVSAEQIHLISSVYVFTLQILFSFYSELIEAHTSERGYMIFISPKCTAILCRYHSVSEQQYLS